MSKILQNNMDPFLGSSKRLFGWEFHPSAVCLTEAGKYLAPCSHLHDAQLRWWQATWKILCEPLIHFTPQRQALAAKWSLAGRGRQFPVFVCSWRHRRAPACFPVNDGHIHFTAGCSSHVVAVCQNRNCRYDTSTSGWREGAGEQFQQMPQERKRFPSCLPNGTTNRSVVTGSSSHTHHLLPFPWGV